MTGEFDPDIRTVEFPRFRVVRFKTWEYNTFYGILIQMYYDDHNPPDFHGIYGDYKAVIAIQGFAILEGDLPPGP